MLLDIRGKVNNIKLSKNNYLLPVYEAIVNSFQSIDLLENKEDTYIKIFVDRDTTQIDVEAKEDGSLYPINGFIVEDNGVGFNDANLSSFDTAESTFKIEIGGKGNGRFLWLKAFDEVSIESNYSVNGSMMHRKIEFGVTDDPVKYETFDIDSDNRITKIKLNGYKDIYRKVCPKKLETIGLKIIEHCVSYFILDNCPRIVISDAFDSISLNHLFSEKLCVNSEKSSFECKGEKFEITHIKLYLSDERSHMIHFCANNREVYGRDLSKYIVNLEGKIRPEDGEKPFTYSAYLSGKLLDDNVITERTGFNLMANEDETLDYVITLKQIEEAAVSEIYNYLKHHIDPIEENKIKKIKEYIFNESPQYRTILKYRPERLTKLSPKLSNKELDLELFKISQELNLELKKQGEEFLSNKLSDIKDIDKYKMQYRDFIEKENDLGKSSLAQYIIHRKIILNLLETGLQIGEELKYKPEEYIHNLIFPMKSTSDDIDYEKHNLWIIDERLAYHYYLASDIKMNQMSELNTNSADRPDLLIIDNAIVVVNEESKPYNSVVIFEFKRPMRNNYDYEDNPIKQVLKYVKQIRNGHQKDKNGREIIVQNNTPFYLYIISDLTRTLIDNAEDANLTKTPDGMGFFGYYANPDINAYIEIVSFDKLLDDAKKRNRILFDKLFKPML